MEFVGTVADHLGCPRPKHVPLRVARLATSIVEALAKAGTLSIVGVYGELNTFPLGNAMEKNITIKMGNCNHRKYIPKLLELVRSGAVDPTEVLTQVEPMDDVIEAYKQFDKRTPGWIKVMLEPSVERQVA